MDDTLSSEIAAVLRSIGAWLRLRGEPGFRAKAYERGAAAIEPLPDLRERARAGLLTELPGIGPGLAKQIGEIIADGRSRYLDELRGELPASLATLAEAAGLSEKQASRLYREKQIADADALAAAAKAGELRGLQGFTEKTEARILQALARGSPSGAQGLIVDDAWELARALIDWLQGGEGIDEAVAAGELRRAVELPTSVELLCVAERTDQALDRLARFPRKLAEVSRTASRVELRGPGGAPVVLALARPARAGEALLRATGPQTHAAEVLSRAAAHGHAAAHGPAAAAHARASAEEQERALYSRAGLPFIPAELREQPGVLELAARGARFDDLIALADLRGAVHCHSTWSDGNASIEEMARAAEARGLDYFTLTDHSPTASYAGGLDVEALFRQHEEIARVQREVRVRILRGTESDITREGALDYPDEVLDRLDVIVASIHNRYRLDAAAMTARVERAMRLPRFKIWGHALGRILLHREPYACDLERILDAIAASSAAIEINGDPHRLDLPPDLIPQARARGIPFVISADAHSTAAYRYLAYGVAIARRAGVRRDEVLNTLAVEPFLARVRPGSAAP